MVVLKEEEVNGHVLGLHRHGEAPTWEHEEASQVMMQKAGRRAERERGLVANFKEAVGY